MIISFFIGRIKHGYESFSPLTTTYNTPTGGHTIPMRGVHE